MAKQITELDTAGAVTPASDLLWLEQGGVPKKVTPLTLISESGGVTALNATSQFAPAGAWYKIASNVGGQGRGSAYIEVSNDGGGFAPAPLIFRVSKSWLSDGTDMAIQLIASQGITLGTAQIIEKIRIIQDVSENTIHVEVFIESGTSTDWFVTVRPELAQSTVTNNWVAVAFTAGGTHDFARVFDTQASNIVFGWVPPDSDSGGFRVSNAGAILALSYGGIAEGNLVDKANNEIIAGVWSHEHASFGQFAIDRLSDSGGSAIQYRNNDGIKGYIGINDAETFQTWTPAAGNTGFSVTNAGALNAVSVAVSGSSLGAATVNLGPSGNINVSATMQVLSGNLFRTYDSGNTKYLQLAHGASSMDVTCVGTTNLQFTSPNTSTHGIRFFQWDTCYFQDGCNIHIFDTGDTKSLNLRHNGTSAIVGTPSSDGSLLIQHEGITNIQTQTFNAVGNSTGAQIKHFNASLYDIGMNQMPRVVTNSNVTLTDAHAGGCYYSNNATTYTITLNNSSGGGLDFPIEACFFIINFGSGGTSGNITVNTGTGTLYTPGLGSTTGSRTVGPGVATIWKYGADTWFLWGDSVS